MYSTSIVPGTPTIAWLIGPKNCCCLATRRTVTLLQPQHGNSSEHDDDWTDTTQSPGQSPLASQLVVEDKVTLDNAFWAFFRRHETRTTSIVPGTVTPTIAWLEPKKLLLSGYKKNRNSTSTTTWGTSSEYDDDWTDTTKSPGQRPLASQCWWRTKSRWTMLFRLL